MLVLNTINLLRGYAFSQTVRRSAVLGKFLHTFTHIPSNMFLKMHIFLAATQKHICILVQIEGVLPLLEAWWQR